MAQESTEEACFFNCSNDSKDLITAGSTRIASIINSSRRRGDGLSDRLGETDSIRCHKNCVSTYTSEHHIKRVEKSRRKIEPHTDTPVPKKPKRSSIRKFDFKQDC